MAAITGFGGAMVRVKDPEALYEWYEKHLGLKREHGTFTFAAAAQKSVVVFTFFGPEKGHFPAAQPVMVNLQVDDLDALLDRLIEEGVAVDPKRDSYDFGKFGWITDPEGNRVELWQPMGEE